MASFKYERGQVLLIVVLAMVVALTVGLSIASRIVTELKVSKQNEESQRAFQAAEAGIQQTLKSGVDITTAIALGNTANFTTDASSLGNETFVNVNNGIEVDQDSGADVWLSTYSPDVLTNFGAPLMTDTITVYWGYTGGSTPKSQDDCSITPVDQDKVVPAIEVVVLEGPKTAPSIKKYVFDAPSCGGRLPGRTAATEYPGGTTIAGKQYLYSGNFSVTNGLVMKVIPIYNSSIVRVQASNDFPNQGSVVVGTGKSGETTRQIRYYTSLPQLPIEVFPYSILSQ